MKNQRRHMKTIRKLKYPITIIVIIIIIIGAFFIQKSLNNQKYELSNEPKEDNINIEKSITDPVIKTFCHVDIKGAVANPGVYQVECGNNVNDIIKLAGGLTDNSNTSVINLAKKITDEMVIIIYTNEEVKNSNVVNTVVKFVDKECVCPSVKNDGCLNTELDKNNNENFPDKININTATVEDLMSLSGVGESKAKAIIEYRNKNGNFKSIEDLLNVSGIGEKLYEEIKIYLTT